MTERPAEDLPGLLAPPSVAVDPAVAVLGKFGERGEELIADQAALNSLNRSVLNVLTDTVEPAVGRAVSATHDLGVTGGEFTAQDEASLRFGGAGLGQSIMSYAEPFRLASDVALPPDIPSLGLHVAPAMTTTGTKIKRGYMKGDDNFYEGTALLQFGLADFAHHALKIPLPILVDPTPYTLEQYAALPEEAADGFAAQVTDRWRSLCSETGLYIAPEPRVIRALGVLPLAPEISAKQGQSAEVANPPKYGHVNGVDFAFAPTIRFAPGDDGQNRSYRTDLLVRGDGKDSDRHTKSHWNGKSPTNIMISDASGRAAPFVVSRAEALAQDGMPSTVTSRSQGAMAIYLTPQRVIEKPRRTTPLLAQDHSQPYMLSDRFDRGLGAASIDVGAGTWKTGRGYADYNTEATADYSRPSTIYVLQLLTI